MEERGDVRVDAGIDDLPAAFREIGVEAPADGAFAEIDGVDEFAEAASGCSGGEEFSSFEFPAAIHDLVGYVRELLEEVAVFLGDERTFEEFFIGCRSAFFAQEREEGFDAGAQGGVEFRGWAGRSAGNGFGGFGDGFGGRGAGFLLCMGRGEEESSGGGGQGGGRESHALRMELRGRVVQSRSLPRGLAWGGQPVHGGWGEGSETCCADDC